MRKKQTIAVWIIVSALYIAGCFWLYFGTLSFDGLDLFMQPEDDAYAADCQVTALLGSVMAMMPIICLWLEFKIAHRFGRLRFWLRRYCGCLIAAVVSAVFLWFWGHAAIRYPYTDNNSPPVIMVVWCGLILNHCIMRARRAKIKSR